MPAGQGTSSDRERHDSKAGVRIVWREPDVRNLAFDHRFSQGRELRRQARSERERERRC